LFVGQRNGPLLSNIRAFNSKSTAQSETGEPSELTHFDSSTGKPKMVSISGKKSTSRSATAIGTVYINKIAYQLIETAQNKKGDVLAVAQLAGIMGAKQTSNLIPLCHPLFLSHVDVQLAIEQTSAGRCCVRVRAIAETNGATGVEMEALTAVQVACLTVWDMLKAVSGQEMCIADVQVVAKSGGKSGDWSLEA